MVDDPDVTSCHTPEYYEKWAPDLYKDLVYRWIDSYQARLSHPVVGGDLRLRRDELADLGRVRPHDLRASFHLACHFRHPRLGLPTHETRDSLTNLWWVALFAYGEGWHNNHHAFQTSARHGLRWWEVDMTYVGIRVCRSLGSLVASSFPP